MPLRQTAILQPPPIDFVCVDIAANYGGQCRTVDAVALEDVGNVAVRGQMDPEALPRPAAEASEDDGLEKAPQVALDAANMDGLYFHGHVFFFEVNYHLVQAAIVLPYRCVEVGREPYDALAGRRKKDGLLGNVKKCSALQ